MSARPVSTSARYANTRDSRFNGKALSLILSIILAGSLAYVVAQMGRTATADVSAQESGGQIISDNRLQASIDVTRRDPSQAAYCIITALDYDKNEVGRREFVIPAGGESVTRFLVDVNTRERGHAAKSYGCSSTIPSYLEH